MHTCCCIDKLDLILRVTQQGALSKNRAGGSFIIQSNNIVSP